MPKRAGDGVSPVQKPPANITPEPDRGNAVCGPVTPRYGVREAVRLRTAIRVVSRAVAPSLLGTGLFYLDAPAYV